MSVIIVIEIRRGNQEWTIQRNWQHWVHKTQDKDKQNKRQHRKLKGQSRMDNPENWLHWVHKTQDKDKQNNKHNTEN